MDAMAFAALMATHNRSKPTALFILQELAKKALNMHLSSFKKVEDYILSDKILLYKVTLQFYIK